ncbi:hypothetical protein [Cohnella thailandensis]|uniref:DUF948 domain-containing protein n=1 Tax=Cohnella thailandensis TaxID=557557 RepID=A0A841T8Q7_9BACL|nr:hypothetical protein [Cohnella thailandensis]MBB6638237.1 hypothetical protein [Cohnella thailandensis]MBP1977798.1 hypothetical protein [Cohnella thailandensis]
MGWEFLGYAAAVLCLTAAVAIAFVSVALRRSLRRWEEEASRLGREAETAMTEWRQLGQEAANAARLCREGLEGLESLAQGGRAIGEAARTAAGAAAEAAVSWTRKLSDQLAATEERQTRRLGETLDWMELGVFVWNAWTQHFGGAPNGHGRKSGENADQQRR